ncbi:MAG: type I restriction-modification system subunit M [Lactobacillus iners]|uniref:type I restriction-modification system subunit M n=2 Tax=Lactobacillus iners TaxID=147802 RepID=UPI002A06B0CD|nr:type I restriction-modification system subunit M [Lactobacillus iners]
MAVKKSELYSILWEACNKLRGGVEPSRYKDYVLVLLFFKYVSDRYKGKRFADFEVSEGASFDELVKACGKPDVGERVDIIIQKFLENNQLKGLLPDVSFNNPDELGKGKELVDKVSGLIKVFQNPAIDFKSNMASGDDIIGDAYEYFMMKFAQESGKSKGQFYTPSEVSRTIARLIGIGNIDVSVQRHYMLHDPAAGSGSLLIRAADEAPNRADGNSIVDIYGQEKYTDTAGLAKMNFILHNKATGEIKAANTLSDPQYIDEFGELTKFDFIVMNPPFSDKDWTDGIKVSEDKFKRFDGYGAIPPEKNGDYAWFLHVLKALKPTGKAGIILPHGILFRGNAEETIRKAIIKKKWIKGIVSLPANLFYGTGIPACIIVVDKENADKREGIFFIDASDGYKKDGNKNRLREQDIEKIVQTFNNRTEIKGYSRFVSFEEIEKNDGNLNVPRYIQKIDNSLPQSIESHLNGGIPKFDIDSLEKLWSVSPELKKKLFKVKDAEHDICELNVAPDATEEVIAEDQDIIKETNIELNSSFAKWQKIAQEKLLTINQDTAPKELIRELGFAMLKSYAEAKILDNYDVYDVLLNYWNEKLQDDVYVIKALGYEAGREIEYTYATKVGKDAEGNEIKIENKNKIKSFDGALIPREILEKEYFNDELEDLANLTSQVESISAELNEMVEEQAGEDSLFAEVLNEKGDSVTKSNLINRINFIENQKVSDDATALEELLTIFDEDTDKAEKFVKTKSILEKYELRNKNGKLGKGKINAAIKLAKEKAELPAEYIEEYDLLIKYREKLNALDEVNQKLKEKTNELDTKVAEKYPTLTIDEIKHLLFDKKWIAKLQADIKNDIDNVINDWASKVHTIASRYEKTLSEIEAETAKSEQAVKAALERMGYRW